jgi:predicted nucleic acid-binding protein
MFAARDDKEWSLTDCISFVVMHQQGLTQAIATDRHFGQAGFQTLLTRSPK